MKKLDTINKVKQNNERLLRISKSKIRKQRKRELSTKAKVWITDNLIDIRKKIKSSIKSIEWSNPQQEIFGIKLKGYDHFRVNATVNLNAIKFSDGYKNVKGDKNHNNYYGMASYDYDLLDGVEFHEGRFMGKSYHLEFVKLIIRFIENSEFTFDDIEFVDMEVVTGRSNIGKFGILSVEPVYWSSWENFVKFPKSPMTEKINKEFWNNRNRQSTDKEWYELFNK